MDEHVIFKFGGDKTGVDRALRSINQSVEKTTGSLQKMVNSLRGGLLAGGLLNAFNMVDGVTDTLTTFINRSKELGKFWGAFSVGGEKAVAQMHEMEGSLERQWEKTKKLRKEREEREKSEKDVQTAIRDITLERASDEEKMNILARERDKIFSEFLKTEEFSSAHHKLKLQLLSKENEMYKLNASMAEKKARAEAEAKKQLELQARIVNAQNALKQAQADRFKNTLGELANLNTPEGAEAKRAMDLQAQAEQARLGGDSAKAKQLSDQADAIVKGTGGAETAETIAIQDRINLLKKMGYSDAAIDSYGLNQKRDRLLHGIQGLRGSEKADPLQQLKDALSNALKEYSEGKVLNVQIKDVKVPDRS